MAIPAIGLTTAAATATAVTTAVTIAAAIAAQVQAQKNAKAQEEAADQRNKAITEQTIKNYDELSEVEQEAHKQATEEGRAVQIDYLRQKGRVNVMAAAMGTGGMSVKTQLQDLEREKYTNYNTILLSRQAKFDNIASQAESLRMQAGSSYSSTSLSRPSWAATALNVGSTVLGGYGAINEANTEGELLSKASNINSDTTDVKTGV